MDKTFAEKPLFSIITITFNSEKTIERTLKSVLTQTYKNFEYIIVDGDSKDSTMDIVRKYEPQFEGQMKWVSEPDKGIYDAMNKGIERSTGDLIGIVNSDDWLEPDAIEMVFSVFNNNEGNKFALYCGGILFHKADNSIQKLLPNVELFKAKAKDYIMSGIRHPATFVPQNVYQKIGVFDTRMKIMADTDFLLRAYYSGVEIVEVKKVLSNMADGGISNILTWKVGKQSYKDKKILLSKYEMSDFKRLRILLKALLIIIAKRTIFKYHLRHS